MQSLRAYLKFFSSFFKFNKRFSFYVLDYMYEKWHYFVLYAVGLWPYQSKGSKRIAYVCFLISSLSMDAALIGGLSDKWCSDPLVILENCAGIIFISSGVIECTILYNQEEKIKKLYKKLANDCREITDEKEVAILKTFYDRRNVVAFIYLLYGLQASIILGAFLFLPSLKKGTGIAANNSVFPCYSSSMILSESIHHYQISVHSSFAFAYTGVCFMGMRSAFIDSVNHVCGSYIIVSYRLKDVVKSKKKRNMLYSSKTNKTIILKLINIVDKHRDAIQGVYMIEDIFSGGFLIIELFGFFGIALFIVIFFSSHGNPAQLIRVFLLSGVVIFYIFYLNFTAQQMIKVSDDIGTAAYSADWFDMTIEARQILQMIITRSCKSEKFTAGSIITMSNMNFALFLKACWSAATVFLSSQRRVKYTNV